MNYFSKVKSNPVIVWGSVCGKINALLNLISYQPGTNKLYWYDKDLYEVKCQLLVNKNESAGVKILILTTFIEYSNDMDGIYEDIEECNPNKKSYLSKKLNISLVFITQSYFVVPKNIRLNSNTIQLWKFETNKSFNKLHLIIHQILTFKIILIFLVIDTTLASHNPLRFRKNIKTYHGYWLLV